MAKNKRLKASYAQVDSAKAYPLPDAIKLIKSVSKAKFDETVEMSMNLGIDPRHADQMVRGLTNLPNGTGKTVRVGVFARGPKANPRLGTVTMDVKGAVAAAKGGQVEFRAEKAGIIHAGIGKVSFDEAKLLENARAFVDAIQRAKPTGAKGAYLKKAAVSSSMGPGVKVDVASLTAAATA